CLLSLQENKNPILTTHSRVEKLKVLCLLSFKKVSGPCTPGTQNSAGTAAPRPAARSRRTAAAPAPGPAQRSAGAPAPARPAPPRQGPAAATAAGNTASAAPRCAPCPPGCR